MKRTWKRLTALLLALAMCLSMLSVSAWAAEPGADADVSPASEESGAGEGAAIVDSGTCGDVATYTLDSEGLLTVSGIGAIDDGAFGDNMDIVTVVIGNGITAIGEAAFYGCENLTAVTIPDSVTTIGEGAFAYCSLTTVTIPAGVTNIGVGAFLLCQNLTDIAVDGENSAYSSLDGVLLSKDQTELICYPCGRTGEYVIPDGVTSISTYAFLDCAGLTAVTVPASVTDLGEDVFSYCANLTAITVDGENSVFSSLDGVLFNKAQTELICCPGGKAGDYVIPDGVTSIADSAFQACNSLTGVTIPASVTSIGAMVFSYCEGLTAITVDGENPAYSSLDGVLFDKAQTELLCCPAGKAGAYAVPDTVTIIGESAFEGCTGLTSVTIPDSVATIDAYAFYDCMGLTAVTMGSGVTSIGDGAFMYCDSLTDVYYAGSEEDWAAIAIGSDNECLTEAAIHYNNTGLSGGTCGDDATYTLTSDGVLTISGTGAIDDGAFAGSTDIVSVVIEDGITSIGEAAFYYCENLTSVTIPDSVTTIGGAAFSYCTGLTAVTIPASVTDLGEGVFYCCTGLTAITVDEENPAYSSLDGVLFDKDQTELICYPGSKAGEYVIPDTVTTIDIGAFGSCAGLTAVTIPASVTTIGDWAFYGCEGLTAVAIPASVTDLGEGVFYCCTSLTAITVDAENSVYSSLDGVLFDKAQTELLCYPAGRTGAYTVPDTVTNIAESAFEGCAGLTAVTIPDTVTTIGDYAFCDCTSLTDVYYAGSEEDWAAIAIGSDNECLTDAAIHYGTTILASGTCGDNATYTLTSDGVLTISGTGAIDRVAFEGNTDIVTVVIEDGITSIGNWAFGDCTSLTSVTIPASVASIGYAAFAYCTGLTDVTISDGVLSIGDYVFYECVGLTAVTIPDSVTDIGSYAFVNCVGLTAMTIPASVTSIGEGVFFGCRSLADITVDEENSAYISLDGVLFNKEQTELICYPAGKAGAYVIPDSVTTIDIAAFGCCAGLTAVTIPDSVTTIGDYVFEECTSLTAVTIPASVTTIGDYIFYFCTSLTDITVDAENSVYSSLDGVLFNKDQTELICCPAGKAGEYVVPDSVTSIAGYAFEECNSLTAVTIPASVTTIGEGAFESCDSLTDITVDGENTAYTSLDGVLLSKDQTELVCYPAGKTGAYAVPDTVTAIGDYAFYDCSGLTSVTMGSGVTTIGEGAFYGCTSLTDVYYAGSEEDWAAMDIGSDNECLTDAAIHYNSAILASGTCGDGLTWTLDADGVLTISGTGAIDDGAFADNTDIVTVVIEDGITAIGEAAFYGCESLTAVTIPAGVTSIGAMTFYGCTSLTAVNIPDSVTAIGEAAFAYCAGLSSVTIPDGVTTIDNWAFYGCESLTAVTIPASVTTMGDYVFVLCTGLTAITVDGENSAYSSLDGVLFNKGQTELICYPGGKTGDYIIPDGVTTITGYAFYGCSGLTAVTVPASVTAIGECVFDACTSLTDITVDGENSAYSSLDGVLFNKEQTELLRYPGGKAGDYVIPDTVTTVGDSAFAYCAGLTAVTIPDVKERHWIQFN